MAMASAPLPTTARGVIRSPAFFAQDQTPGSTDLLFAGVVVRRDGSVAAHAELDLWGITVVADEAGSFEVLTAGSRAGEARIAVTVRAAGCTARTEEIVFTPSSLTDGTLVVLHDFELAPVASSATMSAALS